MSDFQRVSFGLVRDKNGKPKFDDPANVPDQIKAMLTDDDIAKLSDAELAALGLTHRKAN